jgi:hypothetical protein
MLAMSAFTFTSQRCLRSASFVLSLLIQSFIHWVIIFVLMHRVLLLYFIFITACRRHAQYADDLSAPQTHVISFVQLLQTGNNAAIAGEVKSLCGRPNVTASIKLTADISYVSVADANGYFKIGNIKPGTYIMSATLFGYSRLKDTLVHITTGSWQLKISMVCIR